MKILVTSGHLENFSGSKQWAYTVAKELDKHHEVTVTSPGRLGIMADKIRERGIEVVISLDIPAVAGVSGEGYRAARYLAHKGFRKAGVVVPGACEAAQGVEYVEFGQSGVAVYTHMNVGVTNLTAEQVMALFSGEITNWSEVGGPDASIILYVRDEGDSSTKAIREQAIGETPFPATATTIRPVPRWPHHMWLVSPDWYAAWLPTWMSSRPRI